MSQFVLKHYLFLFYEYTQDTDKAFHLFFVQITFFPLYT